VPAAKRIQRALRAVTVLLAMAMSVPSAAASLDEVRALLGSGDLDEALAGVQAYLDRRPSDPDARFIQARILSDLHRDAPAIRIYESLRLEFPDRAELYNNLAVLYARRGDLDLAIETLERAFGTSDTFARIRDNLRAVYGALAAEAYRNALLLEGDGGSGETQLQLESIDVLNEPLIARSSISASSNTPVHRPATPHVRTTADTSTDEVANPANDRRSPALSRSTAERDPVAGQ
jgi:tetratricopeptide (TPR) repeat protein